MAPSDTVRTASDEKWDAVKETIRRLYLDDNNKLEDVIRIMKDDYSFTSAKSNFERRIRKWEFRKYNTAIEWRNLATRIKSREQNGKPSEVYVDGRLVSAKTLQRKRFLYGDNASFQDETPITRSPCDTGRVSVRTPPLEPDISPMPLNLFETVSDLNFYPTNVYPANVNKSRHWLDSELEDTLLTRAFVGDIIDPYDYSNFDFSNNCVSFLFRNNNYYNASYNQFVPPQIPGLISEQQIATRHFQMILPRLQSLLPSNALSGYSKDSSMSLEAMCSAYTTFLVTATANNFVGLDGLSSESTLQYLQSKSKSLRSQLRSFPEHQSKALAEKLFWLAVDSGHDRVAEILLQDKLANLSANNQIFFHDGDRYTALEWSSKKHHIDVTGVLLRYGADPSLTFVRKENSNRGALELAVGYRDEKGRKPPHVPLELVVLLIDNGAKFGYILLRDAIDFSSVPVVEVLLRRLAQIDHVNLLRFGGFHSSIDIMDTETALRTIDWMLQIGADINHGFQRPKQDKQKRYLIEIAAQRGDREIFAKLRSAGAELTERILIYAIQGGNTDIIYSLLAQGVNIDSVMTIELDNKYQVYSTPLAESIRLGDNRLTQLLRTKGAFQKLSERSRCIAAIQASSETGNVEFIQILMGIEPNLRKFENEQFLLYAIMGGHEATALILINHGAHIETDRSDSSVNAIREAVVRGYPDIVRKILNSGSRWNSNGSPLPAAIRSGNTSIIQDLILSGINIDTIPDSTGNNVEAPLVIAVKRNDINMVSLLHRNSACKEERSASQLYFESALEASIKTDNLLMARELLALGVDPCDSRALLAAVSGNSELTGFLLKEFKRICPFGRRGYGAGALVKAIINRDLDLVKILLEHSVDICSFVPRPEIEQLENEISFLNRNRYIERTPLGMAIEIGEGIRVPEVELLLRAGVNPDEIALWDGIVRKETPLLLAIRMKSLPMVKLLIKFGARVNSPPNMYLKRTPLQQAAEMGNLATVQTLLAHGALINGAPASVGGATALHLAAIEGYVGVAEFLLRAGACFDPSHTAADGKTALQGAAENGRIDTVRFLINEGALVGIESRRHLEKATKLARSNGHFAVVRFLKTFFPSDENVYCLEESVFNTSSSITSYVHPELVLSKASKDILHGIRLDGEEGDLPLETVVQRLWRSDNTYYVVR